MEAVAGLFATGAAAAGSAAAATTTAVTAGSMAAGWAATVAPAVASTATMWSVLQGAATIASLTSALGGGLMAMAEGNRAGDMSEIEAGQIRLASEQRANAIKREWLEKSGAARVAFAGSGVDISAGSPAAVEEGLEGSARYATGIESSNAVMREMNALARGDIERKRGLSGLVSSVGKAAGTAASYGIDVRNRG